MDKKKVRIFVLIIIFILVLLMVYSFINLNTFYKKAINNIKTNYNSVFNIRKHIFTGENKVFKAKLKTEHTTNYIHSINQTYEKEYDFIIEEKDNNLYIYVDDMMSKINIDNTFDISKLDSCKYLNKENTKGFNKYNYSCDTYNISIYTSKIFNNYIKSEISYNNSFIEFMDDNIKYKDGLMSLDYSNIKEGNYVLNLKYNDKSFDIFYTYNNYGKYSFIKDSMRVNLVLDEPIVLSINCDTKKYDKLKLTLVKDDINYKIEYEEVDINKLLSLVFSEEIYSLFK